MDQNIIVLIALLIILLLVIFFAWFWGLGTVASNQPYIPNFNFTPTGILKATDLVKKNHTNVKLSNMISNLDYPVDIKINNKTVINNCRFGHNEKNYIKLNHGNNEFLVINSKTGKEISKFSHNFDSGDYFVIFHGNATTKYPIDLLKIPVPVYKSNKPTVRILNASSNNKKLTIDLSEKLHFKKLEYGNVANPEYSELKSGNYDLIVKNNKEEIYKKDFKLRNNYHYTFILAGELDDEECYTDGFKIFVLKHKYHEDKHHKFEEISSKRSDLSDIHRHDS